MPHWTISSNSKTSFSSTAKTITQPTNINKVNSIILDTYQILKDLTSIFKIPMKAINQMGKLEPKVIRYIILPNS
jgi:hypothetical protein